MKNSKCIVFFIFCFHAISVWGQDPQFSNFINNKLYYNPAYAGLDYGLRVNFAFRRQWPVIPSKLQTFYACFDQSVRAMKGTGGFGLVAVSNTEGEGALQKITLGIPLSVRLRIGSKSIIQVGVMPSVTYNSVNWDRFIFNGQLDPFYGNIYSSAFIPPDDGSSSNLFADIFNIGCVFRYENNSFEANSVNDYRKFEIGLSGFHLSQPNQSFTDAKAPLPRKYVLFSAYTTSIPFSGGGLMLVEPSVQCELQWQMFTYMLGVNTSFPDYNIDFGIWYRNKNVNFENTDAIIVLFGYRFMLNQSNSTVLKASLSYDLTVSQLSDATRGSPEISIAIAFNNSSLFRDGPDNCDAGCPPGNRKIKTVNKK
jgi:type IX secretion system PorP/SprF family membrane protein